MAWQYHSVSITHVHKDICCSTFLVGGKKEEENGNKNVHWENDEIKKYVHTLEYYAAVKSMK